MKTSALMISVSVLLLAVLPSVALAQRIDVVPEPSAFLIWAGIAAAAGILGWRNQRRS